MLSGVSTRTALVSVFWCPLEPSLPRPELDRLGRTLSGWEQTQVDRLVTPELACLKVQSFAFMRRVLSESLGVAAEALHLERGQRGKPFLVDGRLRFNLSHSHHLAVLAVCPDREVGVDVEYLHRPVDILALAQRFFSEVEHLELARLPAAEQAEAFYTIWTRKEAYIKALGEGLHHPLDRFCVPFRPHHPRCLRQTDGRALEGWQLLELDAPASYRAALVVEGAPGSVQLERYPC